GYSLCLLRPCSRGASSGSSTRSQNKHNHEESHCKQRPTRVGFLFLPLPLRFSCHPDSQLFLRRKTATTLPFFCPCFSLVILSEAARDFGEQRSRRTRIC